MRGIIADFTENEGIRKLGAISDVTLRTIEENTIVLSMHQHHKKNINMGLDDTRAPFFKEGVQHYIDNGYTVSTRNSGGRSVANDLGVLNFSLILQNDLSASENYMMFYNFVKDALSPLGLQIDVGLVEGAYCPGKFDVSIDGKKIMGTAQRRIGKRVLVGGYLSVNGDQKKRSQIISDFYKITKDKIEVFPEKLTTLQDEYGQTLEVATVKQLILDKFSEIVDTVEALDPSQYDKTQIQKSNERIKAQNEKYLSL